MANDRERDMRQVVTRVPLSPLFPWSPNRGQDARATFGVSCHARRSHGDREPPAEDFSSDLSRHREVPTIVSWRFPVSLTGPLIDFDSTKAPSQRE